MKTFYAVHKGKVPGVYSTWNECKSQVDGFSGAKYKKFGSIEEAKVFLEFGDSPPVKEQKSSEEDCLEIYTDGACSSNGSKDARGGSGVFFGDNDHRNISVPLPENIPHTNQVAELYAIYLALSICEKEKVKRKIKLFTDSKYSINCVTVWYFSWVKSGWKKSDGKAVKHRELIQNIRDLMDKLDLEFVHVNGHQGNYGNEQADRLAVAGANAVSGANASIS